MEWNYFNTFITVSPDCPAEYGLVPPDKKSGRTKPSLEFELASEPYAYTQEELMFEVHVRHKEIPDQELAERRSELQQAFYAKPTACMRASMLPKKYGWGIHFNAAGKIKLIPRESAEYAHFAEGGDADVKVVAGMRSSKKPG
jgi:hypothetical protein